MTNNTEETEQAAPNRDERSFDTRLTSGYLKKPVAETFNSGCRLSATTHETLYNVQIGMKEVVSGQRFVLCTNDVCHQFFSEVK